MTKTADTNDGVCDADCSLREAITQANALPGADTITFNIDNATYGPPPHVITIGSLLPSINQPVTIDGLSEPDIAGGNCPIGSPTNDDLAIQIDDPGNLFYGLLVGSSGGGTSIRGLSITRFGDSGAVQFHASGSVTCSYIGVAADGTTARGNEIGILTTSTSNVTIGGPSGDGNVIANNTQQGVYISGGTTNSILRGNVIRNNGLDGIVTQGGSVTGLRFTQNLIYANGQEGIDLNSNGVTPNDPGDTDGGHNNLQNFPVIAAAATNGAATAVSFTLDSNPGNYTVEFFSNPACDGTNGEGQVYLGSTTVTLPGGPFSMTTLPATTAGHVITATAIKESGTGGTAGDTSEFSACTPVAANTPPVLSGLAFSPSPATAWQPTTLSGTASDANAGAALTLTINWGDGSPDTVQSVTSGTPFSVNHTYTVSNSYTATATVSDGLAQDVGTLSLTVDPGCQPSPVVTNTNDAGAGSLRQAVIDACAGNTITFDTAGTFAQSRTIVLTTGELLINKNLTVSGTGANRLSISGNNASRVFNVSSAGTVALNNLTVTRGAAGNAGGILSVDSQLTITNSVVTGNTATGNAGGIYNVNGTLNLIDSTVSGNAAAGIGGGIANGGVPSVANVTDSTISGNSGSSGGGIFTNGAVTVRGSTITGNYAVNEGGGISNFTAEQVSVSQTIIADNSAPTAPDFRDAMNSQGYNLIGNSSGAIITGTLTGNILNQNPRLLPLGNYGGTTPTHALLSDSPAINSGTSTGASPTDQRGRSRVGQFDIGAFEAQFNLIVTNTNDSGAGSLRDAVQTANSTSTDETVSFDIPANAAGCADGICTVTLTSGELVVNNVSTAGNLTIQNSNNNSFNLEISGNNNSRVFNVGSGANLTIYGLTVKNGRVAGQAPSTGNLGGGIFNNGGTVMIASCTILNNSTADNADKSAGGGIYNTAGNVTLVNSTVTGNTTTCSSCPAGRAGGGGVFQYIGGATTIRNSTISGNTAFGNANNFSGGVYNTGGSISLNIINSIVSGNSASSFADISGVITTNQNNLIGNFANVRLAPLGFYGGKTQTFALLSGSTAIDAGILVNSPVTDQRGASRVGGVDIGAFEVSNSANGGNYRASLPLGRRNSAYNYILVPNNGATTYSVSSGLPNGLNLTTSFAPNAVVSLNGTPTQSGSFAFSLTASDGVNTNVTDYSLDVLPPTAAEVSVEGRVLSGKTGVMNATVTLTDAEGNSRTARTNSFGHYRFSNVAAGQTFVISVSAKRFAFAPQVIISNDNIADLDFIALAQM
ncbi:MAG: CSLREA domain-containing protein [Acidobacteria bacterium]|nr:CSLREA domain-containing protein [Acidobacteriota bacterium]